MSRTHLVSSSTPVSPGEAVVIWIPQGYLPGTVKRVTREALTLTLENGLTVTAHYVSSCLAYGPHWDVLPDASGIRTREQWERYAALTGDDWLDGITTQELPS